MLKYKIEIISHSMSGLINDIEQTLLSLKADPESIKRIESKGMESIFFTQRSNISIIDTEKGEIELCH